jgi:hypothetical protein
VQFSCRAIWAESCSGKPGQAVPLGKLGRKIITNGFRSTRLLKQKRFKAINCQASLAESGSGKPGQLSFLNKKVALEKTFNTTTQRRILRRTFWLIWKNS